MLIFKHWQHTARQYPHPHLFSAGWFQAIDQDRDALIDRDALHAMLQHMKLTDERGPYILSLVQHVRLRTAGLIA